MKMSDQGGHGASIMLRAAGVTRDQGSGISQNFPYCEIHKKSSFFLVAAAAASLTINYHPVAEKPNQYEANVRLPNGSYQRMIVSADSSSNAKVMLQSQYCPQKKDCIASGPHLAR